MDLKEIKQLIRLVDEKKFAEFELEKGDFKLRIKRNETPVVHYTSAPPALTQDPASASLSQALPAGALSVAPAPALTLEQEEMEVAVSVDLHLITSPIVGTFYRAPSPTADPFVQVGDYVESGTILCIVEAMKLMNEIPSDVAGGVVKIHVDNAQPVEYGQPLFSIRVSATSARGIEAAGAVEA
ncbi:MAG: acetyl-CoA carboxylase biotin carboxyl carrier protein [Acidobacteria bacterium]|nr:acetyl-CoA carboxylase biotin carboxyl carrier protein [Acidobacteriota bacterium]